MALISAVLARNEGAPDRYLRRVLDRCREFSDAVLVLDDRSTDTTAKIARRAGCVVRSRSILKEKAWGHEAPARAELWDFALEHATGWNDWVLIADADMVLHGDPRPLTGSSDVNAWAWPLYDLWDSETTYRADQFWRGHEFPRVWMVAPRRVPDGWTADWGTRGIHCGHFPQNFPLIAGNAPDSVYWSHFGWQKAAHRQAKYEQYLSVADQLSPFERAHAESIVEPQAPA